MSGPRASAADLRADLAALLSRARELDADLSAAVAAGEDSSDQETPLRYAARRLQRSVIRPLQEAFEHGRSHKAGAPKVRADQAAPGDDAPADAGDPAGSVAGEALWQLARDATRLRLKPGLPTEVQEATAALQDLAVRFAPPEAGSGVDRLGELKGIQGQLPCEIRSQENGPYLVTNAENLTNWLGERLPTRPQMALCRCGASAIKPYCDGTHADIGFTTEKDPKRVPDRRDTYVGQQVTVLDNRGICQHSGYCTDRLATAFHQGDEPFVTPSGGRMDEIIRAVRDCPSGALSYAIDGREAREQVDYDDKRPPAIEISRDGPYRITGAIALTDGEGDDEPHDEGSSREHYGLCRCGHSQNKPFCSGMHWYVDFKDPVAEPDHEPTIFEWCGGVPALIRMTRLFYEKYVPQDPLLAPLFANMSADHPQRVAKWLAEVFCGPKDYSEEYGGYTRMISQHIGKGLTEEKRARWVALILQSAQETGLPADPEWRSAFGAYIEWGSRLALENSQAGARPPEHMPMPHWDWQTSAGSPGSRISALAPHTEDDEQPAVLPAANEQLSFEKHVRGLFRQQDQRSMKFAFDLWAYDDVKQNARAILERLQNGTMPCDGAWSQKKIDAFNRWVTTGMSP
jgi:CDGSH-type Zn-finger protein/truncated hemoglobin YjbI